MVTGLKSGVGRKSAANGFKRFMSREGKSWLFILPWFIIFMIFTVVPFISSVVLSFTNFNMIETPQFTGLINYSRLMWEDDVFGIALKNTLLLAIVTGPAGFLLSFVFAWGINELTPRFRALLTLMFYTPALAGNVYYIWKFIFASDSYGLMNGYLMRLGLLAEARAWLTDPNYAMGVVILVVLWMSAGTSFLAFIAGLQALDRDLFEAGAIDGIRNRWQELWFISLPQMKPQILLGAVFSISDAFAIGYQCQELTGFPSTDYCTHTILLHINDYGYTRFEMGYASAIQVVLFAMMLLTWYIINRCLAKWGTD